MPIFYFHVYNGAGVAMDDEGQDLPDLAAAHKKAVEGIRSIISEEASAGLIDLTGRLEVADADGNVLLTVQFDETEQLRLREART